MNKTQQTVLYKLIGHKISEYLTKTKGIKQVQLAESLDITKSTLSNVLSGKRNLSLHLLVEISQELEIEPKELLPTLTEINNALNEKQKNIEHILQNEGISANDRNTILNIINSNNEKND